MVKEEIFLDTPIFSSKVSILSGIVAFDVDVEKAKAITGKNFFTNRNGFNLVNTKSKTIYTPKHCNANPNVTLAIYFSSGTKASNPRFAKVLVSIKYTPIGANFITRFVISIIKSLIWVNRFEIISALSFIFASKIPTIKAKKII